MLRLITQLKGQAVHAEQTGAAIAHVSEVLVDEKTGKVTAYLLDGRKRFLSPVDVRAVLPDALVTGGPESLRPREELDQSASGRRSAGRQLVGLKAVTTDGRSLGRVSDGAVDTKGDRLAKVHIGASWWQPFARELVVGADRIVRFEPKRLVLRYDGRETGAETQPEAA